MGILTLNSREVPKKQEIGLFNTVFTLLFLSGLCCFKDIRGFLWLVYGRRVVFGEIIRIADGNNPPSHFQQLSNIP